MSLDLSSVIPFATSVGFGGIAGFLIGYAIKKVMKIMLVIVGLFFIAFIYLEYQKILSVNWNKIQVSAEDTLAGLVNMTTGHIPSGIPSESDQLISAALASYGIPLTGSLAAGFVIGFIRG
jgi:uncharacterized membrane protein (Fun14 family)